MNSETVFVTGGSGFLGSRLLPALVAQGYTVRALVRSPRAADIVAERGAQPVSGNLDSAAELAELMRGCAGIVHAAARHQQGGSDAAYEHDNVAGTMNALSAARAADVERFVMVGAAMCLLGAGPIQGADESWPLLEPTYSAYARTKTIADRAVLAADREDFSTCVVRPAWIWGPGDPQTDSIVAAARAGKMRLIDGGRYPIVTSHIDNTVHAIGLALRRGAHGRGYYVFDDDPVLIRDFIAQILATRGIQPPDKSVSRRAAWMLGSILDTTWALLRRPGSPPISRLLVMLNGGPFLVSDELARTELGYQPVISREEGMRRMAQPPHDLGMAQTPITGNPDR